MIKSGDICMRSVLSAYDAKILGYMIDRLRSLVEKYPTNTHLAAELRVLTRVSLVLDGSSVLTKYLDRVVTRDFYTNGTDVY